MQIKQYNFFLMEEAVESETEACVDEIHSSTNWAICRQGVEYA